MSACYKAKNPKRCSVLSLTPEAALMIPQPAQRALKPHRVPRGLQPKCCYINSLDATRGRHMAHKDRPFLNMSPATCSFSSAFIPRFSLSCVLELQATHLHFLMTTSQLFREHIVANTLLAKEEGSALNANQRSLSPLANKTSAAGSPPPCCFPAIATLSCTSPSCQEWKRLLWLK